MKKLLIPIIFLSFLFSCSENEKKQIVDNDPDGEATDNDIIEIDETEQVYELDHILDIKITMNEKDWEKIQYEGRGVASMRSGCIEDYEYTYFKAEVTVDGEKFEDVGVRKKGFLGSLSALKPSLKLNFGKFVDDQTYSGMKRLTLNNDKQDPSHTHQVMSYALFRKAGLPASRCNLAKVTVNGKDLGVYSNVESIKKPFLRRNFSDDDGNLYEGQIADFTPAQIHQFQLKTNEKETDGLAELEKVVEALYVTDTDLKESLETVIDLDSYLTFWAMETIVGHWDGYNGNKNNFCIYHNPDTELFSFIPWGTDGSFHEGHSSLKDVPNSVYAMSKLANRLYKCDETRELYHKKLRYLLENVWDTEELLAQVDKIEELISPPEKYLEKQRTYISERKKKILDEIEGTAPKWPYDTYEDVPECREPYAIKGSFATAWTQEDNYKLSSGASLEMTIYEKEQTFEAILNDAGPAKDEEDFVKELTEIRFYATRKDDNPIFVLIRIPSELVSNGTIPMHGAETFGVVYEIIGEGESADFKELGFIGDGNITMTESGTDEGDIIVGSFEALLSR